MDNAFRKDKLNNGCIVQLRNKEKYIYFKDAKWSNGITEDILANINDSSWLFLDGYNDDLYHPAFKYLDIMKLCDEDFVIHNLENHLKGYDSSKWTAVREETQEEDLKEIMEEIKVKTKELNEIMKRYEELKDKKVE